MSICVHFYKRNSKLFLRTSSDCLDIYVVDISNGNLYGISFVNKKHVNRNTSPSKMITIRNMKLRFSKV